MSIASHLHHLFNPETCQAYIHTLRWKERPLQCPHCQSHNVSPWGTYHYRCVWGNDPFPCSNCGSSNLCRQRRGSPPRYGIQSIISALV